MTKTNRRTITLMLWAILFTGGAVAGAAEPASTDPLQLVPPESLFCVKINNLDATLGGLDQFVTGLAPFSPSVMAKSQLAQFLGSTDANSINMSGSLVLFGLLPGGETPSLSRIGVLLPVTDYRKFVASNANVAEPDAQGISRIGPEGQQKLIAANAGGYALVTSAANQQVLTEMKTWMPRGTTSLAKRLSAEESKRAQSTPVWAYANVQAVYKMFGPAIQEKLQQAKETFKQMQAQGQGQPMMGLDGVMDMYSTLLNTLMQETQSASLSLDPTATMLRMEFAMAAVPETEMAKALTGSSAAPDRSFVQYLQNGAVMNILAAVDPASWNRFNDMSINLLAQLAGKPTSDPEVRRIRKITTDATNALGGTLAGSFSVDTKGKPPFALRYVVGLKDAQAFNRILDEMPKIVNSGLIADFYRKMGIKLDMELQRKAETYKDVAIDALKITITSTDPNSMQGQIIEKMYGSGMNGRVAMTNNLLVYTIGADPMAALKELIDQVKSPASGSQVPSEVQAAMQLIPGSEKAAFFATYNYPRVLQMAMTMMPMPMPVQPPAVNSQSNIALAGGAANGKLAVQIALPKQHVQEFMGMFMQMQQQQMQQQQQQQGQDKEG